MQLIARGKSKRGALDCNDGGLREQEPAQPVAKGVQGAAGNGDASPGTSVVSTGSDASVTTPAQICIVLSCWCSIAVDWWTLVGSCTAPRSLKPLDDGSCSRGCGDLIRTRLWRGSIFLRPQAQKESLHPCRGGFIFFWSGGARDASEDASSFASVSH